MERYLPGAYSLINWLCFCNITSFIFSFRGNKYTGWPRSKELFAHILAGQISSAKEASIPTRISLWCYWGQRGNFKISPSRAGWTPSLKHGDWLIGLSLPTVLSFGLSMCQKKKKKESNIPVLNFHKLEPTECDKGWLFLNREFLLPIILNLTGSFQLSNWGNM